jgi:hypothetical protein
MGELAPFTELLKFLTCGQAAGEGRTEKRRVDSHRDIFQFEEGLGVAKQIQE